MKKLVIAATAMLACVAAFAQGRITFQNDSLHLVYFTTDTTMLLSADASLAGKATLATGAAASSLSGQVLTAQLWGGASSGNLTLQATSTMNTTAGFEGIIATKSFVSATLPGGTAAFFQVRLFDSAATSYDLAAAGTGHYYGETGIFTTVPSTSTLSYNSITSLGGAAASTWALGTQDLGNSAWGAGAKGAITLQANVPEPTSLALLGLGAAGLMIFRRRK